MAQTWVVCCGRAGMEVGPGMSGSVRVVLYRAWVVGCGAQRCATAMGWAVGVGQGRGGRAGRWPVGDATGGAALDSRGRAGGLCWGKERDVG